MRKYQFDLVCRPRRELREREVYQLVRLTEEAFGFRVWVYDGHQIRLNPNKVASILRAGWANRKREDDSVLVNFYSVEDDFIGLLIDVGSVSWMYDEVRVDLIRTQRVPDVSFFKQSIEIIRPFLAVVADLNNERDLRAQEREQGTDFKRPAVLRWVHYMDANLAEAVGGVDYCLGAPAYKVERFCDGVLFQLTEEPFDNDNPEHRHIQLEAMKYLGVD
jgi:hypothetical protein